jgi:hypothetical protein
MIKLVNEWTFPAHRFLRDNKMISKTITNKSFRSCVISCPKETSFYYQPKGGKGGNLRKQFGVDTYKKSIFIKKQGYVDHIIASIANEPN